MPVLICRNIYYLHNLMQLHIVSVNGGQGNTLRRYSSFRLKVDIFMEHIEYCKFPISVSIEAHV